jgi:hypothetical protein
LIQLSANAEKKLLPIRCAKQFMQFYWCKENAEKNTGDDDDDYDVFVANCELATLGHR